ncbi:vanadium-dependent haloperoxidase [Salsipaludibacter albus]|uniref:vanadium-dependent haloperoxidase n=1 Tax=Salsipaludibacter albus TaxID=2849650 RepID=UPI001EE3BBCA|nr:vanadium-dependent haloperoxidase [Salsipaludibacter albus]MBY5163495.1 vanadium-dependent haloperoxidase [Salsipaludibacter albus]
MRTIDAPITPQRSRRPIAFVALVLATLAATVTTPWSGPAPAAAAAGDPVIDWNRHATDALLTRAGQRPPVAVIHLAMVHGAVHDAVVAIRGGYEPYLLDRSAGGPGDSVDAAVATAAHDVLVSVVPDQASILDQLESDALAALPAGPSRDRGVAVGAAAAAAMVADRSDDGRYGPFRFPTSTAIGGWRPVEPSFGNDPNAWVARVRPFLVDSAEQFRSGPPPALHTPTWARDYEEVRLVGGTDSDVRTADQTEAARYWAENPPAIWSRVLRQVATDHDLEVGDDALLFARAYLSAADAMITVWDSKAHWLFWRPITAIEEAGDDGNRWTSPEPGWTPLLPTPPYPEHPSGHLGLSGSMIATMRDFFHTDAIGWTDTNGSGRTRSFTSLSSALDEVVSARIWSGIHFRTADEDSARIGKQVVRWGASHHLRPRPNDRG